MKYTNSRAFVKHLESAHPDHFAPVYLIVAKDSFESQSAVNQLQDWISPKKPMKVHEAGCLAESAALDLNSFSMFSDKEIIVLHQIEKASSELKKFLEQYLQNPGSSATLVMTAYSLAASTKLYKYAEKIGVILNLSGSEKPWEKDQRMTEWLITEAKKSDKQLDQKAARSLIKHIGTDVAMLHSELAKIICYVGKRSLITLDDIDTLCPDVNQDTAFKLGEAIFHLDTFSAMRIGKALLKDEVPLIVLLRQIRKQFQTDFYVCSVLENGFDQSEITKAYPYMRGRILEQHVQMAKCYGIQRFKKGLIDIDRVEVESKNSMASDDVLLEMLITRLAK